MPFAESKHENTVRFVNDVRGWGKICRNLFIYNYTVNFRNYLFPFPNVYVMKSNYRMFLENGARWIYDQADSNGHHAEFAELKCYLQYDLGEYDFSALQKIPLPTMDGLCLFLQGDIELDKLEIIRGGK